MVAADEHPAAGTTGPVTDASRPNIGLPPTEVVQAGPVAAQVAEPAGWLVITLTATVDTAGRPGTPPTPVTLTVVVATAASGARTPATSRRCCGITMAASRRADGTVANGRVASRP